MLKDAPHILCSRRLPRRGTSRKGGRCEPHGLLVGAVGAVGGVEVVRVVGVVRGVGMVDFVKVLGL